MLPCAVDENGAMLAVHVHVHVQPDRVGDFLAASLTNARASLTEEGVLRFDVLQDQADPSHVVLNEVYTGPDAAAAHKQTAHYATWRDAVADMMAVHRESTKFDAVFPESAEAWGVPR